MGTDKPKKKNRITDPSQAPTPPPGQGPVLAWYESSRREAFVAALTSFGTFGLTAVGFYFASIITAVGVYFVLNIITVGVNFALNMIPSVLNVSLFTLNMTLLRWWWLFAVIGLLGALGGYFRQRIDHSAGADWLQDRRHRWVKLYELTKVRLIGRKRLGGNNYLLFLIDRDGHVMAVRVNSIQDRDMWDLVYNGILHSVIIGEAETNRRLHAIINVPRPYPKTG